MKTPLLEIKNLSISFKTAGEAVVKNVSFSIERGQTMGIVGESGSGKTLTALAIMGLLPKTSICSGSIKYNSSEGEISLGDQFPGNQKKIRGKRISMIFQEPMSSLNPSMKCGKQVAEMLMEHSGIGRSEIKKRVVGLFREVQLPEPEETYSKYPHQLSGGQRQRVMIAMAISCKPDLLIADEPTTALDVTIQKVILELLASLSKKYNLSILMISHDLGVIANIAQKLMVMYQGEAVEQGDTTTILKNPGHTYTRKLLDCKVLSKGDTGSYREELINVDNLTTTYIQKKNILGKSIKEFSAVKNVSFRLYKGETLGLVGESGCGKTSLGRTIIQLIKANEGQVRYLGTDLNKLTNRDIRKFRKNLQIIFQDPFSSLNPGITAGEAIMEPMTVHGLYMNRKKRKEKALELLDKVALDPDHFHRYPHQFSGGQRQRIGIARALAVEPEMIICDESVSALDVSVQAQILDLLNNLKNDFGLTYLFISHDLNVVRYMSDRIMVMKNGEIVESGDAEQVFNKPAHEYTVKLLEAIPKIRIN